MQNRTRQRRSKIPP